MTLSLNNTPFGEKKRNYFHDDLWNIKYLPKFKWSHLQEKQGEPLPVDDTDSKSL